MTRHAGWWMIAAALLAGCQAERYRSMQMGSADYDRVYLAAVETLRDYYPILSADPDEGRIVTAPRNVGAAVPLLSRAWGREWAQMRIRRSGPIVWADIRVITESQGAAARQNRREWLLLNQDITTRTPAETGDPYLDEQEPWTPVGTNTEMEWRILDALYDRLHP